jgi:hypothetical protein
LAASTALPEHGELSEVLGGDVEFISGDAVLRPLAVNEQNTSPGVYSWRPYLRSAIR